MKLTETKVYYDFCIGSTMQAELINSFAKSAWYARRQHSYNICNSWM